MRTGFGVPFRDDRAKLANEEQLAVPAKGICRTRSEETGAEYATVNYGTTGQLGSVTRGLYEKRGYYPPYDDLPVCEVAKSDRI